MPSTPLELLALRWVPGEGPVEFEPVSSGLVNDTWRVRRDGRSYSLRMARGHAAELGLDRSWECRVLACAAAAGIAPPVHACAPDLGLVVSGWAGGEAWSAPEVRLPANIEAMARLLRQVHALQSCKPARTSSPAAWIAHYSQALSRGRAPSPRCAGFAAGAADRLARLTAPGTAGVLCHSDLHRLNIRTGPPTVLLDWEYAHVSDPLWDLAGWVSNNDGSAQFASELHGRYLGRAPSDGESSRLEQFIWLYEYVALLWSELFLSLRPDAAQGVAARADELGRRLAQATGGRAGQVTAH